MTKQILAAEVGVPGLVNSESESDVFELKTASGCAAFPEAELNATGTLGVLDKLLAS